MTALFDIVCGVRVCVCVCVRVGWGKEEQTVPSGNVEKSVLKPAVLARVCVVCRVCVAQEKRIAGRGPENLRHCDAQSSRGACRSGVAIHMK